MPVGQPPPLTPKYTVRILSVDPSQNLVEVQFKNDVRRVLVYNTPVAFRWPIAGETWWVRQENGNWYLDDIAQNTIPPEVKEMHPGDVALNSPTGVIRVVGSTDGASDFTLDKGSIAQQDIPPSRLNPVLTSIDYGALSWDLVIGETPSTALQPILITLPPAPLLGDQVAVVAGGGTLGVNVKAQLASETINQYGFASSQITIQPGSMVWLVYYKGAWFDISSGRDQAITTPSLRTLGTGSQQALPGDWISNYYPPIQSVSFGGDFQNFGNGYAACRYWKDPLTKKVNLQGVAMTPSGGFSSTICQLPSGFRPTETHAFTVLDAVPQSIPINTSFNYTAPTGFDQGSTRALADGSANDSTPGTFGTAGNISGPIPLRLTDTNNQDTLSTSDWHLDSNGMYYYLVPRTGNYFVAGSVGWRATTVNSWGYAMIAIDGVASTAGVMDISGTGALGLISAVVTTLHLNQGQHIELWGFFKEQGMPLGVNGAVGSQQTYLSVMPTFKGSEIFSALSTAFSAGSSSISVTPSRVDVHTDGTVVWLGPSGLRIPSLDSISFLAAP